MAHMNIRFSAVYEPVENGWTQGRIIELPAVITAGPTLEETKELLLYAVREYLLAQGKPGETMSIHDGAEREYLDLAVSA